MPTCVFDCEGRPILHDRLSFLAPAEHVAVVEAELLTHFDAPASTASERVSFGRVSQGT